MGELALSEPPTTTTIINPIIQTSAYHAGDDHPVPAPAPPSSITALKDRIKQHYEVCSDYYHTLWGEHIHHGYFLPSADDTKEAAQTRLITLLLDRAALTATSAKVLDVGCGIGGTSRYLARERGCHVTGVTISRRQVEIATRLSASEASASTEAEKGKEGEGRIFVGPRGGSVRFLELDAEALDKQNFDDDRFDCVWIAEALSHLPHKELFFRNAAALLRPGGKLVIADWFKREGCTAEEMVADIQPIEDGMLLPPLCTVSDYVAYARDAGLTVFAEPFDISKEVARTWDISWDLIQSPALWAFAISQGRDGLAFLQAFRAMRRGFASGSFRYSVMVFQR